VDGCHRADQFLDDDRLADTRTPKDACLAALGERGDKVDDLDTGLEDLHPRRLLRKIRGCSVDGIIQVGVRLPLLVHRVA
jgi:hypothetical protein